MLEMLKIELYNPETERTEIFTEGFVPARTLRKVLEFADKQEREKPSELETLDEMVSMIASFFRDDRVTFDAIYDGIPADKLSDEMERIMTDIMGGEAKKKLGKNRPPSKKA
jgi:hypothetical protein